MLYFTPCNNSGVAKRRITKKEQAKTGAALDQYVTRKKWLQ